MIVREIWRPIEDYPDYKVSDLGNVVSYKRGVPRILSPWLHKSGGYPAVKLSVRGQPQRTVLVHQLVCRAFHGPKPSEKHEVAHNDGCPTNVAADNLRWAMPIENHFDKRRHGTHFNSGQFNATLSDDAVREIRGLLAEGMSQTKIAARFGVWQTTISHIKTGRRRSHIQ